MNKWKKIKGDDEYGRWEEELGEMKVRRKENFSQARKEKVDKLRAQNGKEKKN